MKIFVIIIYSILTVTTVCAGTRKCPWDYFRSQTVVCNQTDSRSMADIQTYASIRCEYTLRYINMLHPSCTVTEDVYIAPEDFDTPLGEELDLIQEVSGEIETDGYFMSIDLYLLQNLMQGFGLTLDVLCINSETGSKTMVMSCRSKDITPSGKNRRRK